MQRNNNAEIHQNDERGERNAPSFLPSLPQQPRPLPSSKKICWVGLIAICSLVSMEMMSGFGSSLIIPSKGLTQRHTYDSSGHRGLRHSAHGHSNNIYDQDHQRQRRMETQQELIERRKEKMRRERMEERNTYGRVSAKSSNKRMWPDPDILRNVAVNNTIIMISANCGYVNMAQNWILHVTKLGITNFIVIAQDETAFDVLNTYVPGHVVMLDKDHPPDVHVEQDAFTFASEGFYEICKQRPHMIQSILNQGYNVLYSDTDLVWLKNPFEKVPDDVDYVGMTDVDNEDPAIDQRDVCSAFLYFRPNYNTTQLLSHWTRQMMFDSNARGHDQDHWRNTLQHLKGKYSMHLLPKQLFPPGFLYFNVVTQQERITKLVPKDLYTVHANWMAGYSTKVNHLKEKGQWIIKRGNELICRTQ